MEYGKHFLVEIVAQDSRNLGNKKYIEKFMTRIIKDLSMTTLRTADVYKFPYPGGGITGFCLIAESHVSIHTWPEKKYFSLDVFSCRNFNEEKIERIIRESFAVAHYYDAVIERGLGVNFRIKN